MESINELDNIIENNNLCGEPVKIIIQENIKNKGTGAGGMNTTYYGKKFEEKTNNQIRLINNGYITNNFTKKSKEKYNFYLSKTFEDKTVIFVLQNGLKSVNDFLKKKLISNNNKYIILNTIFNENNIVVLFGDDENYFETFDIWFNNSL